ncbi:MAG: glycosyltransferase [Magnetococcales bacterium]|nr:glycosyltransferase [Magnetococcales bacterium]
MISVIIPCFDSATTIGATLNAITRQQGVDFEVIVVNSPDPKTEAIIREQFPQVTLLQQPQKTSAAEARNRGTQQAQGAFFAFLDSDCTVDPDWLQRLLAVYDSKRYCGVGGPIKNGNPESHISWAGYLLEFSDFLPDGTRQTVSHIPSGNLFLSREVFNKSGGFPEQFGYAQEDRLFSLRLVEEQGKPFLFNPETAVYHQQRSQAHAFLRHQYHIGQGGAEILKRVSLRGSALVAWRQWIWLLLPLIPFIKLSGCLRRAMLWQPKLFLQKPPILWWMLRGTWHWAIGFCSRISSRS